MKGFGAAITAISYYLPEKVVDNKSLVQEFGTWTEDKIYQKTGIRERHVVDGELVSDLAARAAEKLFEEHGVDRETIDFLLLCTESPDHYLPATACIVQDMVGLKKSIGALDYNLGCSGFVYGLALAKGLISAGIASKILLITADTLTRTRAREPFSVTRQPQLSLSVRRRAGSEISSWGLTEAAGTSSSFPPAPGQPRDQPKPPSKGQTDGEIPGHRKIST